MKHEGWTDKDFEETLAFLNKILDPIYKRAEKEKKEREKNENH